jgi:hypothetical protein
MNAEIRPRSLQERMRSISISAAALAKKSGLPQERIEHLAAKGGGSTEECLQIEAALEDAAPRPLCRATKKDGTRCGNRAERGAEICNVHRKWAPKHKADKRKARCKAKAATSMIDLAAVEALTARVAAIESAVEQHIDHQRKVWAQMQSHMDRLRDSLPALSSGEAVVWKLGQTVANADSEMLAENMRALAEVAHSLRLWRDQA